MFNLTLRHRFALLTGALAIVVIAESVIILNGSATSSRQISQLSENVIPTLNKARQLKLAVTQVQQWLTDISATRGLNGLDDGFIEAENNAAIFRNLIHELQAVDSDNSAYYQEMVPVFEDYYSVGKKMAKTYVEKGPEAGNQMMPEFDAVAFNISEKVEKLLRDAENNSNTTLQSLTSQMRDNNMALGGGFLVIFLGVGLVFMLMRQALSFLPRIVDELKKVASGILTGDTPEWCRETDELAELCDGVNEMKTNLRSILSEIAASSSQLTSAAGVMSRVSSDTMEMLNQHQTEINQIATAMTQMSASAQEVASSANSAADSAGGADHEACSGKTVVSHTVDSIGTLADSVAQASGVIKQLEQHSENIGGILDVIRDIADQTNLLALNAAIEAARAGDHGRGFAVVADEVRLLASKTQESTQQIHEMIEQLQSGARDAVQVMSRGRSQTEQSVEQAKQAMSALHAITVAIASINRMSTQIAAASTQQSTVAEDISKSINTISYVSEQTASSAQKTAATGEQLSSLALQLQSTLGKFAV